MAAAGEASIPRVFVVNRSGRIAWIGHPMDLEAVLEMVIADTLDIEAAQKRRDCRARDR